MTLSDKSLGLYFQQDRLNTMFNIMIRFSTLFPISALFEIAPAPPFESVFINNRLLAIPVSAPFLISFTALRKSALPCRARTAIKVVQQATRNSRGKDPIDGIAESDVEDTALESFYLRILLMYVTLSKLSASK